MRMRFAHTIAAVALASLTSIIIFGAAVPANAKDNVINVVAAANFTFTPSKITTRVGQKTTLHLTSSGGVHGVESKELGIDSTSIAPEKAVDVSFTPKKAGTYKVPCSIVCGAGHADMMLTVVVTP